MATVDKEINVRLAIQPDETANARAEASIKRIEDRLTSVAAKANSGFPQAARSTELFLQGLNKAAEAAKNYEDNIAGAVDKTKQLNQEQNKSGGGGGFGLEGLRRTGGAISQLGFGELGGGLQRLGDIGQIGKELGQLGDNVGKLSPVTNAINTALPESIAGFAGMAIALGAVTAAGAIFTIGLQKIKEAYDPVNLALKEGVDRLDTYYEALKNGDPKQIEAKKKQLEIDKEYSDKELEVLKYAKEHGFEAAQKAYGDLGARLLTGLGATGAYGDGIKKVDDRIKELTDHSNSLTGQIAGLGDALESDEIKTKIVANAILQNAADVRAQTKEDQENSKLSVAAAKQKLQAQKDLLAQDSDELAVLLKSGDTSKETTDRIKELQDEIDKLNHSTFVLENNVIRDAEKLEEHTKVIQAHSKALDEANKSANEAAKAEEAKNKSLADATKKYDDDVDKITQQGIQDRLNIEKKYQDTLVSIATKAAQEAADDLRKLQDEQSANRENFNRSEQDANAKARFDDYQNQIKVQQEETKALVDHQRKLEDIRKQGRDQELGFLLNRDFLGLLQSRIATSQSMQNENTSFVRGQQDRSGARQQQVADNARQLEFDHQQRIIAYQRANQDAERNYQIQIRDQQIANQRARQAALQGEQQQLGDLQKKITAELTMRRQGIIEELKLIQMGDSQKLALEQKYLAQAKSLLGQAYTLPDRRGAPPAIQYTQNISTPNANPAQVAAISGKQTIEMLRKITGAGV